MSLNKSTMLTIESNTNDGSEKAEVTIKSGSAALTTVLEHAINALELSNETKKIAVARKLSAAKQVADNCELLENILSHTDPKTLLRAKSASRKFNSLINTSAILQERLFLKTSTKFFAYNDGGRLVPLCQPNRLLFKERWDDTDDSKPRHGMLPIWECYSDFVFDDSLLSNRIAASASCRNMHLFGFAVKRVRAEYDRELGDYLPSQQVVGRCGIMKQTFICHPEGVRWGHILEWLEEQDISIELGSEVEGWVPTDVHVLGDNWEQMSAEELFEVDLSDERMTEWLNEDTDTLAIRFYPRRVFVDT